MVTPGDALQRGGEKVCLLLSPPSCLRARLAGASCSCYSRSRPSDTRAEEAAVRVAERVEADRGARWRVDVRTRYGCAARPGLLRTHSPPPHGSFPTASPTPSHIFPLPATSLRHGQSSLGPFDEILCVTPASAQYPQLVPGQYEVTLVWFDQRFSYFITAHARRILFRATGLSPDVVWWLTQRINNVHVEVHMHMGVDTRPATSQLNQP